ncbi:MAG: hypothetical protein ABEJ05_04970 [Haloglomus sp.]
MATPSTTSADSDRRSGPSIPSSFTDGIDVAVSRPWLALVPFVVGLLSVDQLERAARSDVTVQVNFGLPTPVAGLWTFLNAPANGISVFGYSATAVRDEPVLLGGSVLVAAGTLLVVGLLGAVYLGAIDDALAGRPTDHLDNLRRYAPITVAFAGLQFLGIVAFVFVAVAFAGIGVLTGGSALAVVPVFLASLVGFYLLTPGVYAGVAADLDPRPAFARGVRVALDAEYLVFALGFALAVAVCSVPVSALGFSAGLPGLVLAAVLAAPVGLALNAATMAFVRGRVGAAAPDPGGSDGPTPAVRRVSPPDDRE